MTASLESLEPKKNPAPEEVLQLVLAARQEIVSQSGVRQFSSNEKEEVAAMTEQRDSRRKKEMEEILAKDDNADGYGGFYQDYDAQVFAIMERIGLSVEPSDIMVMPGKAGMTLIKGGNPAITITKAEEIDQFQLIALTDYGPGSFKEGKPRYTELAKRIRMGTILIAKELMADNFTLCGTIWHECGHKVLRQPKEAGEVFAYEINAICNSFGVEQARKWIMGVRKPEYFREYGLSIDPGRNAILSMLKDICTEEQFYKEFKAQYEEIMGSTLKPSDKLAELLKNEAEQKLDTAAQSITIGTIITGTLGELKKQIPEDALKGFNRGSVRPATANDGDTVTFAGKRWRVESKKQNDKEVNVFALKCTHLTESDVPTKIGSIYGKSNADGTFKYGLTKEGPWVYDDTTTAETEYKIVTTVYGRVTQKFKISEKDEMALFMMIVDQVSKTHSTKEETKL